MKALILVMFGLFGIQISLWWVKRLERRKQERLERERDADAPIVCPVRDPDPYHLLDCPYAHRRRVEAPERKPRDDPC